MRFEWAVKCNAFGATLGNDTRYTIHGRWPRMNMYECKSRLMSPGPGASAKVLGKIDSVKERVSGRVLYMILPVSNQHPIITKIIMMIFIDRVAKMTNGTRPFRSDIQESYKQIFLRLKY